MTPREIARITLTLVLLYVVAGVLMAAVYSKTSPIIYRKAEEEKRQALQALMPMANAIDKLGDWYPHEKHAEYFVAKKDGQVIGYVVQSFGKGYSSYINVLFSVDTDLVIQKIDILHHAETPGLGDEIEYDWFKQRFVGKRKEQLKVLKVPTEEYIQAITGATISTRAVAEDAIKGGIEFLEQVLKEGLPEKPPTEEAGHGSGASAEKD
jgi:electron transport complex protein RnfG